jgi:hypothetical protein
MIIVKVELHSAIDKTIHELARMHISNDGTGTDEIGNYKIELLKRGSSSVYRIGKVLNHARKRLSVWILVIKALGSVFKDRAEWN